jgi:creatinine amidohydrolase
MKRKSWLLAECTLLEVEEHIARNPVVLVPVGATEQHGPHAPFGTDYMLAAEVCRRIAPRLDALVAPPLPFGVSGDHLGFPGVPFLSARTMGAVVQDLTRSLSDGGFRTIIFVNGHYTNVIALHGAIMDIGHDLPKGTAVFPFTYWDALTPEELGQFLSADVGLHANIGETSLVMAIDEGLVDMDHAAPEYPDAGVEIAPALVSAFFFSGNGATYRATKSGVWGDPTGSSAELGERYFAQIEEACVRFVEQARSLFTAFPQA